MFKLLLFLRRAHFLLLFLVLEAIAISLFLGSNIYQKAKVANASSQLASSVYGHIAEVRGYFGLRDENTRLLEEIGRLRNIVSNIQAEGQVETDTSAADSIPEIQYYQHIPARVVRNKISKRENYITINRGSADGIEPNMALISQDGIVGYVISCSDHYSVAVSILNTKEFNASGRLKGTESFGPLYWDGQHHREVVLDEIPKYADIHVGDTVLTTEYSTRFPPNMPVGTVLSFEMTNGTYYKVRLRLFADLAALRSVLVVRYIDEQERRMLEQGYEESSEQSATTPQFSPR